MTEQRQCRECQAKVDETEGRIIILDHDSPAVDGGFLRSFLCIQCKRDWRERDWSDGDWSGIEVKEIGVKEIRVKEIGVKS